MAKAELTVKVTTDLLAPAIEAMAAELDMLAERGEVVTPNEIATLLRKQAKRFRDLNTSGG